MSTMKSPESIGDINVCAVEQYQQRIEQLEQELEEMTVALTNAWDQLVPFLQETPPDAEKPEHFSSMLYAVTAAADTELGGIFLFQAEEWVAIPEELQLSDDAIQQLTELTSDQVLSLSTVAGKQSLWSFSPILSEGNSIGVLGIGSYNTERQFTVVDVRIVKRMADRISSQITALQLALSREREAAVQHEMQIAYAIQQSIQPELPPKLEVIQLASYRQPAKQVGGDAWGWIVQSNGKLVWFILDVAGKGLPAALAAVTLHTAIRMGLRKDMSVSEALTLVNEELYGAYTLTDLMATAALISLDPTNGRLEIANAGHPPILVRQSGKWQKFTATAPPIGVLPDLFTEIQEVELQPGDLVICYSDGFTEIQIGENLWGEDGLLRSIPIGAKNVTALTHHIVNVAQRVGEISDDQTLISALYSGSQ